jgi:glycogen(starch) synthase
MALGVPAITSDLSGFGAYLQSNIHDHAQKGLYVLSRHNRNFWEMSDELTNYIHQVVTTNRRERVELRNRVESLSEHFDWGSLENYYIQAQEASLSIYRRDLKSH